MSKSISEQKSIVFIPFQNQVILEKGRGQLFFKREVGGFFSRRHIKECFLNGSETWITETGLAAHPNPQSCFFL